MIHQVSAHPGEVTYDIDALLAELLSRPDP
jgi:hypothetical protein